MKKFLFITAIAAVSVGVAAPAVANFVHPGRVIIGTGIYGGGGFGGSTFNAMGEDQGCVVAPPIECECEPGMLLLDACHFHGVDTSCLKLDTPYDGLFQTEPVLVAVGEKTLGNLICSGKSDQTALVSLPKPKP